MTSFLNMSRQIKSFRISQIFFWSVITAAFIGPGTITTALKAGSGYQLNLLWTILFSIVACIVLQEAASRLTIASGLTLGEAIQKKYRGNRIINFNKILTVAVIFGCIAYQVGNLTGATSGIQLMVNIPRQIILTVITLVTGILMWRGRISFITNLLGTLVVIMAILFVILALQTHISLNQFLRSLILPNLPSGSSILVIGLIGTTIVPYNLFLGSGLSHNKELRSTRFGLITSILIGGLITIFIMMTGTLVQSNFNFRSVSSTIQLEMGPWAANIFALGLFAAGFTSSITAPLAAAITMKTFFQTTKLYNLKLYRITWIIVLLTGLAFSLFNIHPIIIIVLAQAINGLILPFIAISIFLVLNDKNIISGQFQNGTWYNILMLVVVGITFFLGIYHLFHAF